VIHHFASEERRLRAVAELVRVTALKGRILITVWAFEQVRESGISYSMHLKRKKSKESGEKSKRQFDTQDVTVPWVLPAVSDPERKEEVSKITDEKSRKQLQPVSVDRFCHVFVKNELETLVSKLPNVQILESYFDNANWAVVLRKISL
jgi:alkylated DNA repair protein alkB family protein 8